MNIHTDTSISRSSLSGDFIPNPSPTLQVGLPNLNTTNGIPPPTAIPNPATTQHPVPINAATCTHYNKTFTRTSGLARHLTSVMARFFISVLLLGVLEVRALAIVVPTKSRSTCGSSLLLWGM
jgi:hypothetical protein